MHLTVMGETARRRVNSDYHPVFKSEIDTSDLAARSLMIWGEHCTDCANPMCYTSCSLYTPREDLKCRRFTQGLQPLVVADGPNRDRRLLAMQFRKWGKLEAEGSGLPVSSRMARAVEAGDEFLSRLLDWRPIPYFARRFSIKAWNWAKRRMLRMLPASGQGDGLLIEAINSGASEVGLRLTIFNALDTVRMFDTAIRMAPGFNRILIDHATIAAQVEIGKQMRVVIEPIGDARPALTLLTADFVEMRRAESSASAAKAVAPSVSTDAKRPGIKCVVWDLDNTLWSGTLTEDGADNIMIKPEVIATIVELDKRGVLNSIVSKNDLEPVERVLRKAGLWDYFLFPQVNWQPKSQNIRAIAQSISIGLDTFLFIDDQPFERAEVEATLPMVDARDIVALDTVLVDPRMPTVITKESANRRLMYQQEQARTVMLDGAAGDYGAFLKSCDITLAIDAVDDSNFDRVFELTERTNQLNYAARRSTRPALQALRDGNDGRVGHVLSARDRFGDYGIIGFAIVDEREGLVTDFFMSCRVQRKRVDHAYFDWLRRRTASLGASELGIVYRASDRNAPSRAVLADDMRLSGEEGADGAVHFKVPLGTPIVDADIVTLAVSDALDAESVA